MVIMGTGGLLFVAVGSVFGAFDVFAETRFSAIAFHGRFEVWAMHQWR